MPTLGNALDFAKYEARNIRAHQLGTAPSSPVTGQLYYNTADNTLYWWNGTAWISATGGVPSAHHLTHEPGGSDAMAVDAAAATGSLRTLGSGAAQAMPGNRTLDAILSPVADRTMNGFKIISLQTPTNASDAANKQYVDDAVQGLSWKNPVVVVGTASISGGSAPTGAQTIDGVVLANGDRVLLTGQTNAQYNGIWQVATSASWNRAPDANTGAELVNASVYVQKGTANADTAWVCTTDAPITIDTTPLAFAQFTGAAQITAGAGLLKTGNVIDVGAGAGITVNADTIQVANDGITNAMIADGAINLAGADVTGTLPVAKGGTGGNTAALARNALSAAGYYSTTNQLSGATYSIPQSTHLLGAKRGLLVQVQDETSGAVEIPDVVVAANGDVAVTWGVSQTVNSKRVTIIG